MNTSTPLPGGLPAGAHLDLRNTFGALYIGGIVGVGLLGITTLQAWFYFRSYPEDSIYTKLLVVVVWSLEFVRSTFVVHGSYYYAILNWGNFPVLSTIVWSMSTLPLLTNIVELIVQLYFAWRIWILSRLSRYRWGLPSVVALMALTNFGTGVAVYSSNLGATSIAAYEGGAQKVLSPLALATSMAANVAIMVALSYLLHRSRSGLKSTNHLINVLMFYTIQAGALIIVVDIAVIILNQYFSRTGLVYIAVYSMLGNLYANSVLASLNARASLRDNHRSDGIISASGPIVWRSDVSTFETARGGTQTGSDTVGGSTPALTSEAYQLHLLAGAGRRSESKGHDTKVTVLDNLKDDADSV